MKKFLALLLVFFSAGMAFVVGEYLGVCAQKDRDSLKIGDLHPALINAVDADDASVSCLAIGKGTFTCERKSRVGGGITPVLSHASGTLTLPSIQKPKRHHRKAAAKTCIELKPYVPGQLGGMGVRNWIAPEHQDSYYCGSNDCLLKSFSGIAPVPFPYRPD